MKSLEKFEGAFAKVKDIYILVYITYILLARIVPLVNFITLDVNSVIYSALAIAGVLILAVDFLMHFTMFKSKENIILFIFLIVCVISSVLNIEYGIVSNVKTIVWSAIQFFLVFSIVNIKSENEICRTMDRVMKISSAIWFVGVLASLVQFFTRTGYVSPFEDFSRRQGFVEARLFGVFTDPNFAAVTSIMIVLFCWLLLKDCNKKWVRGYYITNIVVQLIYIVLSGSRTALYGGVVLSFIIGMLVVRNKLLDIKEEGGIVELSIAGGVVAVILCFATIALVKNTIPQIADFGNSLYSLVQSQESDGKQDESKENRKDEDEISLERPDVNEGNISNNRYEIWSNYIEVSADHRIFGLSPRNLMSYLEANYPDNFLVTKGYDETHNGWLAIFVCTGITGTAVMAAFFGVYIYHGCRYLKSRKEKTIKTEILVLFGCVFIIALSAILQPEIFFINTYGAVTFWLFMGYLLYYMKKETAQRNEE